MPLLSPTQAEEQLRHVSQQFAQWRQSRTTPRGRILGDAHDLLLAESSLHRQIPPPGLRNLTRSRLNSQGKRRERILLTW